eukprot:jgi/Chrzof1/11184/Cz05g27080.t1
MLVHVVDEDGDTCPAELVDWVQLPQRTAQYVANATYYTTRTQCVPWIVSINKHHSIQRCTLRLCVNLQAFARNCR